MTIELDKLRSARLLLRRIESRDRKLTWYNLVRYVDQCEDAEKDPPSLAVLRELTRAGYVAADPPNSNAGVYSLTPAGRELLSRLDPGSPSTA